MSFSQRHAAAGNVRTWAGDNYFTEMRSGSEEGSYLRLIDCWYPCTAGNVRTRAGDIAHFDKLLLHYSQA